jgi:hypothetical protein
MRPMLPLTLSLVAAVLAVGCRTASDKVQETALRVPERDLTLQQPPSPEVEVASPVELARAPIQPPTGPRAQHPRRRAPAPRPPASHQRVDSAAPAHVLAPIRADSTATIPGTASLPRDPHALAPGETVTVIPVSSGPSPSSSPGWSDEPPPESSRGRGIHIGSGGGCDPRGRGPGFRGFRGPR